MPVGGGGAWPDFEARADPDNSDPAPLVWRVWEGLVGLAAVPVGGGRPATGDMGGAEATQHSPLAWSGFVDRVF